MKSYKSLIEMFVIFLLTFLYSLICTPFTIDEIWNFGFSYNIINNLIPYKDFNMILTPLYPFLGALFMFIFGKKDIVFLIFNALISIFIFKEIKNICGKYVYIVYFIYLLGFIPNYNLLCLLLLFILIKLEKEKKNDYLIGVTLGLTFLTKQNIGIYLCIPSLFTKDCKKIIKRMIGFLFPNVIFLIYLLITDSLYEFIDYAFLGISSFSKQNYYINYSVIAVFLFGLSDIYKYIKNKNILYLYFFFFLLIAYPIFDNHHFLIAIVPSLTILLSNIKIKFNPIYLKIFFTFVLFDIFVVNFYKIQMKEQLIANKLNMFNYRVVDKNSNGGLLFDYIKENKDIIIIGNNAYLFKLVCGIPITKYDLINNGNMGKNGDTKIINELEYKCKKEKCRFLLEKNELNIGRRQTNEKIYNYVLNNYQIKENISNYIVLEERKNYEKK